MGDNSPPTGPDFTEKLDCAVRSLLGGQELAVATIGRDRASLEAHAAMISRSLRGRVGVRV